MRTTVRAVQLTTVLALALATVGLVGISPARADAAFAVSSPADDADGNVGDGTCSVAADGSGPCTLRAAIDEANSTLSPTVITVPPGTIVLGSELAIQSDADVTVNGAGPGVSVLDGGDATRHFSVNGSGSLTLADMTLQNGRDTGPGSVFTYGDLVLDRVELVDNEATRGEGGALEVAAVEGHPPGTATIRSSTIAGNHAAREGGAIYAVYPGTSLTISNSTITGNTTDGDGGGLVLDGATTDLRFVTIVDNQAGDGAAGDAIAYGGEGDVTVTGSILEGGDDVCVLFEGPMTSGGGNVVGDDSCLLGGPGDLEGTTAGVQPLADNGGPTRTMALTTASPAVDHALADGCPSADQRRVARPQREGCDAGAFELAADPVPAPPPAARPATATPSFTG